MPHRPDLLTDEDFRQEPRQEEQATKKYFNQYLTIHKDGVCVVVIASRACRTPPATSSTPVVPRTMTQSKKPKTPQRLNQQDVALMARNSPNTWEPSSYE